MKDFYSAYYPAIARSQAHHAFCERVYGIDLGQHGFADLEQLNLLLQVTQIGPAHHVLDLGCGSGLITEYLAERTGAHFTGIDYVEQAIDQALQRTAARSDRLTFCVGDINRLELPRAAFDAILLIDTIYFSDNYNATIQALRSALRPGGQLAIFYSYGRTPWVPKDAFPKETLPADKTPLADALRANGLPYRTWDLTRQDYELARRRRAVLAELRPQFADEDALFIYDNRLGDSNGICQAIEEGLHARYLYQVRI